MTFSLKVDVFFGHCHHLKILLVAPHHFLLSDTLCPPILGGVSGYIHSYKPKTLKQVGMGTLRRHSDWLSFRRPLSKVPIEGPLMGADGNGTQAPMFDVLLS